MKQAKVYVGNILAGVLTEDDMGYEFMYDSDYLKSDTVEAVSLTLPLSAKPYRDKVLFRSLMDLYRKAGCSTLQSRAGKYLPVIDFRCSLPVARIASAT